MSDLLKLAERCEQAIGPDLQLDRDIFEWLRINTMFVPDRSHQAYPHHAYTASLDAAMALVPEGLVVAVTNCGALDRKTPDFACATAIVGNPDDAGEPTEAATPALALSAAALKARAASGTLTEGGDAEQAPGDSLSGPTLEEGDAQ